MKGQNISELVELSQSGDESAFEILFKTFQTRLHHSLFKVLETIMKLKILCNRLL